MRNLVAAFICVVFAGWSPARVITVDADAPADFTTIQAAIDDANDGDTVEVQPGTYTGEGNRDIDFKGKAITVRGRDPNDANMVAATIIDCAGTDQYRRRGFRFISGESPNSVLAGLTIMNGYGPREEFEHPLYGTWEISVGGAIYCRGSNPTIKQVVISDSAAINELYPSGYEQGAGGGIFTSGGNPVITACRITGNSAASSGGGICSTGGEPTVADCTVCNNTLTNGGGGGGIYISSGTISNCTVMGNSVAGGDSSTREGGGIFATGGNILIKDCSITNNYVLGRWGGQWRGTGPCPDSGGGAYGGGVSVSSTTDDTIEIRNCILAGNTARGGDGGVCVTSTSVGPGMDGGYGFGGAIYASGNSTIISNCTIADNAAQRGNGGQVDCQVGRDCDRTPGRPGKSYGGAMCLRTTAGLIHNCILSNNTAEFGGEFATLPRNYYPTEVTIAYCDVDGGEAAIYTDEESTLDWGRGNIDADPCFAALGYKDDNGTPDFFWDDSWLDGDFHLKSRSGRWDPNSQGWVRDDVQSLCIDAGDPSSEITLEPLPNGGIINMGAYGGTAQASMSANNMGNTADRDNDGFVYRTDLLFFANQWLVSRSLLPGDFISDDIVNFPDFAVFAQNWECPPLPQVANRPNPADGATGVMVSPWLTWVSDPNARAHDVYFGTASPGTFRCRQSSTTFQPSTLSQNRWYYWHINEIGLAGEAMSPVWSFKTGSWAICRAPSDGAVYVLLNCSLQWQAGPGALSHDIYFGTISPGSFVQNQTWTEFYPGSLSPDTTYYWRIDEVTVETTTTGAVWSFRTGPIPGPVSNPAPPDHTVNVPATTVLSWEPGLWASSHDVYFGTASPGSLRGRQSATTFRPPILSPDTTYYWRIDEVNPYGSVTGPVWTFTTGSLPPQAVNPDPFNSAENVGISALLSWDSGSGSESHDVYFGTSSPGEFQGNQAQRTFDPGVLSAGTRYYWRIDEVNSFGATVGSIWSFTTGFAPGPPANPFPPNNATYVPPNIVLTWESGINATSQKVYFGFSNPPDDFQGERTETIYDPGILFSSITYYWRVDQVNSYGTTTGPTWSFTTGSTR